MKINVENLYTATTISYEHFHKLFSFEPGRGEIIDALLMNQPDTIEKANTLLLSSANQYLMRFLIPKEAAGNIEAPPKKEAIIEEAWLELEAFAKTITFHKNKAFDGQQRVFLLKISHAFFMHNFKLIEEYTDELFKDLSKEPSLDLVLLPTMIEKAEKEKNPTTTMTGDEDTEPVTTVAKAGV